MTDDDRDDPKSKGERQAINTGTGVALGAGVGTAVFAMTDDPRWIALGAGLGAAFGAAFGAMRNS